MARSGEAHLHSYGKAGGSVSQGQHVLGLCYMKGCEGTLRCCVDASYGSDDGGRRSTRVNELLLYYILRSIGCVLTIIMGAALQWVSRDQNTTFSSNEAEYVAMCRATQDAVRLRRLLRTLNVEQHQPTLVYWSDEASNQRSTRGPVHAGEATDYKFSTA